MSYEEYLRYLQLLQQGEGEGGITNVISDMDIPVGQQAPGGISTLLASMFAPPVGLFMQAQRMADRGNLPLGLNRLLGSRASGGVEMGIPQSIQTSQPFVDEVALTGRDGGGDRPGGFGSGAVSFRESDPTATEGSF